MKIGLLLVLCFQSLSNKEANVLFMTPDIIKTYRIEDGL